jgi:hypothetical protein
MSGVARSGADFMRSRFVIEQIGHDVLGRPPHAGRSSPPRQHIALQGLYRCRSQPSVIRITSAT